MDDLDIRILQELQTNGRKKNVELASELGVAPSTVLERVRRLEENGHIQGYRAVVDPSSVGLDIQAIVAVTLDHHQVESIKSFEEGIRRISHVRVCYHSAGRFDYLLHVAARDLEQLGELIKDWIASIPGIGKVETFLLYSEVIEDRGWPINQETPE